MLFARQAAERPTFRRPAAMYEAPINIAYLPVFLLAGIGPQLGER